MGWVLRSSPYLQDPVEAGAAFSTMARVSAQRLEKGGEEQDEKMLQGSGLEDQEGNRCDGILAITEAYCFPLHRRKQSREDEELAHNHKDARSPGSASLHLLLSYRWKGWDSESPSPSWESLEGRTQEGSYSCTGRPRKGLPEGTDGCRRPGLSLGVLPWSRIPGKTPLLISSPHSSELEF